MILLELLWNRQLDMWRSTLRRLGSILATATCWVLVFPTMVALALTLILTALMMKLNDYSKNFSIRK